MAALLRSFKLTKKYPILFHMVINGLGISVPYCTLNVKYFDKILKGIRSYYTSADGQLHPRLILLMLTEMQSKCSSIPHIFLSIA